MPRLVRTETGTCNGLLLSCSSAGSNLSPATTLANSEASVDTLVDLPPLKWSSLKYVFRMEEKIDGKEEAYG